QALAKRGQPFGLALERRAVEEPDHRHRRLLRARSYWPSQRAAEQRDELAAFHHSITSSARAIGASLPRDLGLATRAAATMLIFLYLGSAVPSAPIQSGSVNFWSASLNSISASTTPAKSPS